VYTTSDLIGVEWAAALVGCAAILTGYVQQAGLGAGALATAMTRAMHEAAILTQAAGGAERTLFGLAGYGDLLAAISQRHRPEIQLGVLLARGRTIDEAVARVSQRVEGADLIPRLSTWAKKRGLRVPIFDAMAHSVYAARPVREVIYELMTLPVEDPG
jgi:glycerol-3-phosphate dehydrogenase (NAD(P)+)